MAEKKREFGKNERVLHREVSPKVIGKDERALHYGDNLTVLRNKISNEMVDLIYLDPPFKSNLGYRYLDNFDSMTSSRSLGDIWKWGHDDEQALFNIAAQNERLAQFLFNTVQCIGRNDLSAYLVMMGARLMEMHRVLKSTGSIYLHCDSTASHYLKVMMDVIFGFENFRNEIIWKSSNPTSISNSDAHNYSRNSDIILFYSKGRDFTFNQQYMSLSEEESATIYRHIDEHGRRYRLDNMLGLGGAAKGNPYYEVMGVSRYWRYSQERMQQLLAEGRVVQTKPGTVPMYKRYIDESLGSPVGNIWTDIPFLQGSAKERLGYPTQKPLALLERILAASSNEGDVVLDPFCGCGTTIIAAEKMRRAWIGIDITYLSISLVKMRLKRDFNLTSSDYIETGMPNTLEEAQYLLDNDPYQFQFWILAELGAQPFGRFVGSRVDEVSKVSEVDGLMHFVWPDKSKNETLLISVKGKTKLNVNMIHALSANVRKAKAAMGVIVCLDQPTKGFMREAAAAGSYVRGGESYPLIQVITVAEVLAGARTVLPKGTQSVGGEANLSKGHVMRTGTDDMQTNF